MTYCDQGTRHCTAARSSNRRPRRRPTNAVATTAAIIGPNETIGVLLGDSAASGQLHQDRPNASTR
jgi:hypothetical protein